MAGAGRGAVWSHSLVDYRLDDELEYRAGFDIAAGAFPRHGQSRLFHHQIGAIAAGGFGPDRGRDRTSPPGPGADVAMTAVMPWLGLSLLIFVGLGVVFTGIPAAVVLLAAACFGAAVGAISGAAPVHLLGVLPERLINLLENDLLQAIPLYVLMGALINRLPLADALYRCSTAPRRNHYGSEHAWRRRAALAGADPSGRRHAERPYDCGHRNRPRRPRDQHAGCISRRVGPCRSLSRRLPRDRVVVQSPAQAGPSGGFDSHAATDGAAGSAGRGDGGGDIDPARRRRRWIFLCR